MHSKIVIAFTGFTLLGAASAADYNLNSSSGNSVLIDALNTGTTNKTHLNIVSSTASGGTGVAITLGDGTSYVQGLTSNLTGQNGYGVSSTLFSGNTSYAYALSGYAESGNESISYGSSGGAYAGYDGIAYGVYGYAGHGGGPNGFSAAGYFPGDVWANSFPTISDRKFKQDIRDLTGGLNKILALKPRTYTYKADEFKDMGLDSRAHIGFIAQEIGEVLPELVVDGVNAAPLTADERKQGVEKEPIRFKGVDYVGVVPVLVKAVQEQQALIESMRAEIAALKAAK